MPGSARGHYRPPARSWLTPNRRGLPETWTPRPPARGRDPWTEAGRSGATKARIRHRRRTPPMERREAPALSKRQRGLRKTGAPRGAPFPSDWRGGETCPRERGMEGGLPGASNNTGGGALAEGCLTIEDDERRRAGQYFRSF